MLQRLRVGVGDHKINAVQLFLNHVIDSVPACTANAKYCNTEASVRRARASKDSMSCSVRLYLCPAKAVFFLPILVRF